MDKKVKFEGESPRRGRFREKILESGTKIILGKDAKSNDILMDKFKGKNNTILHTLAPGSPFCIINNLNPSEEDVYTAGIFCAKHSQSWRDNKGDVLISVFIGKDVSKSKDMKIGTWNVKKSEQIIIKKEDIEKQK